MQLAWPEKELKTSSESKHHALSSCRPDKNQGAYDFPSIVKTGEVAFAIFEGKITQEVPSINHPEILETQVVGKALFIIPVTHHTDPRREKVDLDAFKKVIVENLKKRPREKEVSSKQAESSHVFESNTPALKGSVTSASSAKEEEPSVKSSEPSDLEKRARRVSQPSFTKEEAREILGVSENASQKEIKDAYKALTRKYHPDKNSDDPDAKPRFQAIQLSYEKLIQ
ncbi:MAG: J domain-containing protein [Chlamydiia bacterium]|nr:J domain-containing protein [Chlamydiia bacterium]